jgi:hypothetical protein
VSQIIAWKCDYTGRIFESKGAYETHLRKVAKLKRHREHLDSMRLQFAAFVDNAQNTLATSTEISRWISSNYFLLSEFYNTQQFDSKLLCSEIDIQLCSLTFCSRISNSHCAPKGKETNWWRNKEKPLGYPGWRGRIEITTSFKLKKKNHNKTWESRILKSVDIFLGTGGGTQNNFQYDVILWCADWKGMARSVVLEKLAAE